MKTTPEFGTTIRIRRKVFGYSQRELGGWLAFSRPISPIWKAGAGYHRLVC